MIDLALLWLNLVPVVVLIAPAGSPLCEGCVPYGDPNLIPLPTGVKPIQLSTDLGHA